MTRPHPTRVQWAAFTVGGLLGLASLPLYALFAPDLRGSARLVTVPSFARRSHGR